MLLPLHCNRAEICRATPERRHSQDGCHYPGVECHIRCPQSARRPTEDLSRCFGMPRHVVSMNNGRCQWRDANGRLDIIITYFQGAPVALSRHQRRLKSVSAPSCGICWRGRRPWHSWPHSHALALGIVSFALCFRHLFLVFSRWLLPLPRPADCSSRNTALTQITEKLGLALHTFSF